MKTLRYLILLLTVPCAAQWTTIGYSNLNQFDIPVGTYTFQYGCAGNWTAPLTLTYPIAKLIGFNAAAFALKGDPPCPGIGGALGQPSIQVQQQAKAFSIGVHTWNGTKYGAAVAMTIPALTVTPAPTPVTPPAPVTSVPMGATGSCTWTLTIDATGNPLLTIK